MLLHRQTLRRWAASLALLWLLGVGVGVANACVFTERAGSHAEAVQVHGVFDGAAQASAPGVDDGGHALAASDDEPGCQPRVHCVDYCAKTSVAMVPLKLAPGDFPCAVLPAETAQVVPAPEWQPVLLSVERWCGVRAAPIRIALLRLAL